MCQCPRTTAPRLVFKVTCIILSAVLEEKFRPERIHGRTDDQVWDCNRPRWEYSVWDSNSAMCAAIGGTRECN